MEGHEEHFLDLGRYLPVLKGDGWRGAMRGIFEELLGFRRVWEIERELGRRVARGEEAFDAFRDLVGFTVEEDGVCAAIPPRGALIVIANHPFGGADAVALGVLCKRVRPDTLMLANAEASLLAPLQPSLLPLEIMGGERRAQKNLGTLRSALGHLRRGGLLVVFPAGAVAHWQAVSARVEDPPWSDQISRLIGIAGGPVLPVGFPGRNGDLFQLIGMLHPLVRSGLLPRMFLKMQGQTVRCRAGALIAAGAWPEDLRERTRFLRQAVEAVRR